MLTVSLLGAPQIERDGRPAEVDTRKATALLAYVAVTGRPHTRDALAALLWPEYDQEHARGALRRTLSTLRKALGPERVETGRELVGLVRDDDLRLDVEEFRRRISSDDPAVLGEAAALYRGDFLAGFTLRDSVDFDDWQFFEADSLRRELAGVLERLADAHAARGDYEKAISHARRWLHLNQLHEPAHRRLLELYALQGERGAALRQYRECVRVLDAELGVAPVEETTELYRAVQENRLRPRERAPAAAAAPSSSAPIPPRAREAPPLVGRSQEWAALAGAYDRVRADGRLVVVEGEAGIGKTRLCDHFLADVEARGAIAIAVQCYEDERELAYAPVAGALRRAVSLAGDLPPEETAELGRLLPEAGPVPAQPLDSAGAQTRFLETLSRVVKAALAGHPPGVLLFDDVHHADAASLDFVAYLARRLRGRPLLLLLNWRSEDVPPGHRLRRLAAEAVQAGSGNALSLSRLRKEDVEELARALAPDAGDGTLGERIHRETGGLPLFVVEYLQALANGDATALPPTVRELLQARLASLDELPAQVLAAAAVVGRPFDADVAREVSGRTDEETVAALEQLGARAILDEIDELYDFRHEQLRGLAYERASLARRRLLHRRAGAALSRRPGARGPLAAAIARHFQQAGLEHEAAECFQLAGEHARSVYANADALAHFQAALALGHPEPGAIHEAIGDVQTLLGDYVGALASYEAAAARASAGGLAAIEHKLGALAQRRGAWDVAAGHLEAALEATPSVDAGRRARILADLSLNSLRRTDDEPALRLAHEALAAAEGADDRAALAQAHNILGMLAKVTGDGRAARDHLESSLRWAAELGDAGASVAALNNLALLDRAEGDLEQALARTKAALELCATVGDRHREAALHNNLADLLHAAGRQDEAMAELKRAVALFAEIGEELELEPEIWKLVEW